MTPSVMIVIDFVGVEGIAEVMEVVEVMVEVVLVVTLPMFFLCDDGIWDDAFIVDRLPPPEAPSASI